MTETMVQLSGEIPMQPSAIPGVRHERPQTKELAQEVEGWLRFVISVETGNMKYGIMHPALEEAHDRLDDFLEETFELTHDW